MTTREIVQEYYDVWLKSDGDTSDIKLAEDIIFTSPFGTHNGADELRLVWATMPMPEEYTLNFKHWFIDGENACVIYDFVTIKPEESRTLMADWFTLKNGEISEVRVLMLNPAPPST